MSYRTASYAEAQRSASLKGDEGTSSPYRGTTTKSQAFFRKMDESHSEAERLRLQCRTAANSSAARNTEERVELSHIKRTIAESKAVSSYAQGVITDDVASRMDKFTTAGAPMWLGHLADPKHFEQKEFQPQQASPTSLPGLPGTPPKTDAKLPSAVEQEQTTRDEYTKAISEGLSSYADQRSATKESEAMKLPPLNNGSSNLGNSEASPFGGSPGGPQGSAELRPSGGLSPTPGGDESVAGRSQSGAGSDAGGPDRESSSESSSGSDYDESEASDAWPPSPPVLRFKMRMQFSDRFRPTEAEANLIREHNADLSERFDEGQSKKIDHIIVLWLNERFSMNIGTQHEFEVGFPVVILTMMDAIYPKRVRWHEVDWRFQYKRAMMKNFSVIDHIWNEVNMEKAREFRVENTHLRLESMPMAPSWEKLEFMQLMKRWYDQRIHASGPYDPMAKRKEMVEVCQKSGHYVKFPPWIKYDKEYTVEISAEDAQEQHKAEKYSKMPEYKRLIYFLGCQEYQSM